MGPGKGEGEQVWSEERIWHASLPRASKKVVWIMLHAHIAGFVLWTIGWCEYCGCVQVAASWSAASQGWKARPGMPAMGGSGAPAPAHLESRVSWLTLL